MSSSDSDDDCYGNIAQKLATMKNSYQDAKIENREILDESNELDEIINNLKSDPKAGKGKKCTKKIKRDEETAPTEKDTSAACDLSQDLDYIIASNENLLSNLERRGSRRGRKKQVETSRECDLFENLPLSLRRAKRTNKSSTPTSPLVIDSPGTSRGKRGRRRPRGNTPRGTGNPRSRGRPRRTSYNVIDNSDNTTIYSIGNTEDYPDQSDSIPLFSNQPTTKDVVVIDDEFNDDDENEELSVKVYWQNNEVYKFTIRKFQKLSQIFQFFAAQEKVEQDKLLITYNDRIIKADDTPESIKYNIGKFIDGGIINQTVQYKSSLDEEIQGGIKLKFQCQNRKKPYIISIGLDDKLQMAMVKCAEHIETSVERLKFEFDGDIISGKNTARELDLEGDECIDVKIIS